MKDEEAFELYTAKSLTGQGEPLIIVDTGLDNQGNYQECFVVFPYGEKTVRHKGGDSLGLGKALKKAKMCLSEQLKEYKRKHPENIFSNSEY